MASSFTVANDRIEEEWAERVFLPQKEKSHYLLGGWVRPRSRPRSLSHPSNLILYPSEDATPDVALPSPDSWGGSETSTIAYQVITAATMRAKTCELLVNPCVEQSSILPLKMSNLSKGFSSSVDREEWTDLDYELQQLVQAFHTQHIC